MTNPTQDSQSELRKEIEIEWLWLTHSQPVGVQKSVDRTLDKMVDIFEAYVTTRVKEAERLARINQTERLIENAMQNRTVMDFVSSARNHLNKLNEALTTTTNGKGE